MSDGIRQEYQEILNQLHSDVFLQRMKDHTVVDDGSSMNEKNAFDLNDLDRHQFENDAPATIASEEIEMLLEDDELSQAILTLIKVQAKEA